MQVFPSCTATRTALFLFSFACINYYIARSFSPSSSLLVWNSFLLQSWKQRGHQVLGVSSAGSFPASGAIVLFSIPQKHKSFRILCQIPTFVCLWGKSVSILELSEPGYGPAPFEIWHDLACSWHSSCNERTAFSVGHFYLFPLDSA